MGKLFSHKRYDEILEEIEAQGGWGEDEEEEVWQIVTTVRQDPLRGLISKESPAGRALLGKREGDTVFIQVNKDFGYDVIVRAIEKGQDDGSAQLNEF